MNLNSLEEVYSKIKHAYPEERLVFGDGNSHAPLLLIGEAPGKDEVALGRPFVGKAGKNLDGFLEVIGLTRSDLYITNVCKFRPTKISAKNTISNRPPTKQEVLAAKEFLYEEISVLAPKVIVTLGNTPLRALTNDTVTIGDWHGIPKKVEIFGKEFWLFALYHPASIIYNPSLKQTYGKDLEYLAKWLREII